MNILAIIQARMGSTRLPNKVSMTLGDKTVLENVVDRVKKSRYIDEVAVATTIHLRDLVIVKLCASHGIRVFCGSEDDVLDRFYQAAKLLNPVHIVRITADCPVIDSMVIDGVIERHLSENADYSSNTLNETFPDGEDVEIFTFAALKQAWKEAQLASEREHVTPYIRKHTELFKHLSFDYTENLSKKRWTLDDEKDYEFLKILYDELYKNNPFFGMSEILELLKKNPDYEKINSETARNAGYIKSLKEDRIIEGVEQKDG